VLFVVLFQQHLFFYKGVVLFFFDIIQFQNFFFINSKLFLFICELIFYLKKLVNISNTFIALIIGSITYPQGFGQFLGGEV